MNKVILNVGDCLNLDLNIKVSVSRTLSFDKDELDQFLDHVVRKFLSDPDFVQFGEESKL